MNKKSNLWNKIHDFLKFWIGAFGICDASALMISVFTGHKGFWFYLFTGLIIFFGILSTGMYIYEIILSNKKRNFIPFTKDDFEQYKIHSYEQYESYLDSLELTFKDPFFHQVSNTETYNIRLREYLKTSFVTASELFLGAYAKNQILSRREVLIKHLLTGAELEPLEDTAIRADYPVLL